MGKKLLVIRLRQSKLVKSNGFFLKFQSFENTPPPSLFVTILPRQLNREMIVADADFVADIEASTSAQEIQPVPSFVVRLVVSHSETVHCF